MVFVVELGCFSKLVLYHLTCSYCHHVFQEKPSIMDDFKWWWWSWKFWKETNFGWRWWEIQWNWDFQQEDQSWKWKCFQQAYGNWLSLCLLSLSVCHNHIESSWFFQKLLSTCLVSWLICWNHSEPPWFCKSYNAEQAMSNHNVTVIL